MHRSWNNLNQRWNSNQFNEFSCNNSFHTNTNVRVFQHLINNGSKYLKNCARFCTKIKSRVPEGSSYSAMSLNSSGRPHRCTVGCHWCRLAAHRPVSQWTRLRRHHSWLWRSKPGTRAVGSSIKGKGHVQLLMGPHITVTGCHLPYGITQCYLSPDTNEHTPP